MTSRTIDATAIIDAHPATPARYGRWEYSLTRRAWEDVPTGREMLPEGDGIAVGLPPSDPEEYADWRQDAIINAAMVLEMRDDIEED